MAQFEVVRHTTLPAPETWSRLTDWSRHGEFIPFTEVTVSARPDAGVGTVFVARTACGPLAFDDPMEVTYWRPPAGDQPGVCRIVKRGRVVQGWAVLTISPTAAGSTVAWREDASIRLAGPLLDLPNRIVGKRVFGRLVDGLLDDA